MDNNKEKISESDKEWIEKAKKELKGEKEKKKQRRNK